MYTNKIGTSPLHIFKAASLVTIFAITTTNDCHEVLRKYEMYQYLDHCNGILPWRDIIDMLWGIAGGLERIHDEGKIHGNLHGGNLLVEDEKVSTDARISDVGLHGPCNYENKNSNQIYGVLPYVAPEVLRGKSYSTKSD